MVLTRARRSFEKKKLPDALEATRLALTLDPGNTLALTLRRQPRENARVALLAALGALPLAALMLGYNYLSGGGLFFDYDNDGWPDALLVDGGSLVDQTGARRARHRRRGGGASSRTPLRG